MKKNKNSKTTVSEIADKITKLIGKNEKVLETGDALAKSTAKENIKNYQAKLDRVFEEQERLKQEDFNKATEKYMAKYGGQVNKMMHGGNTPMYYGENPYKGLTQAPGDYVDVYDPNNVYKKGGNLPKYAPGGEPEFQAWLAKYRQTNPGDAMFSDEDLRAQYDIQNRPAQAVNNNPYGDANPLGTPTETITNSNARGCTHQVLLL